MKETIKNGWSHDVLEEQIKYKLYERQAIADKVSNFENTLPNVQSDLAIQTMKDPYIFDFIVGRIIERLEMYYWFKKNKKDSLKEKFIKIEPK